MPSGVHGRSPDKGLGEFPQTLFTDFDITNDLDQYVSRWRRKRHVRGMFRGLSPLAHVWCRHRACRHRITADRSI